MSLNTSAPPTRPTESVSELLKDLRDDTSALVRQEVALARQEISEKAATLGRNTGYLVVGGLVAYAGTVVLCLAIAAIIYAVLISAEFTPVNATWIALTIVGVLVAGIGGILISKAIATFKTMSMVPERTIDTLKDDTQWVKDKVTR